MNERRPGPPALRIGFVLLPRFTLTAFAGFIDALRLAADEGDRSRPIRCTWEVLGEPGLEIESSCGVRVVATAPFGDPARFDYIVVVGGLLHGGQRVPRGVVPYLRKAARLGVKLVALCTGSFVLARAGLLNGYVACVSWFHREDFIREFPHCKVTSSQMYVVDRDRLTCAGGTSAVHLAAFIIEGAVGRSSAVKALRIMIERQPLPPRTLQPEQILSREGRDSLVRKAMLMIEQDLASPQRIARIAQTVHISRRQLERRFLKDIGMTPSEYRERLRVDRARWLLENTDLQVAEIADQCGFHSSTYLGRVIRRRLGCSPSRLRRSSGASDQSTEQSFTASRKSSSTYGAKERQHSTL